MNFQNLINSFETWGHWGFVLQINAIVFIMLLVVQVKMTDNYERLVHFPRCFWRNMRRNTIFLEMLMLCWAVVYGFDHGWQPWPPFVAVLFSLNLSTVSRIFIIRQDINRVREDHLERTPEYA